MTYFTLLTSSLAQLTIIGSCHINAFQTLQGGTRWYFRGFNLLFNIFLKLRQGRQIVQLFCYLTYCLSCWVKRGLVSSTLEYKTESNTYTTYIIVRAINMAGLLYKSGSIVEGLSIKDTELNSWFHVLV